MSVPPPPKHRSIGVLGDDLLMIQNRARGRSPDVHQPLRVRVLTFVGTGVIVILLLQAFRLQLSSGGLFRREAEDNRAREFTEYAPRGLFLDRHGTPLVTNVPAMTLVAEPAFLPDDVGQLFEALREALPSRDLTDIRERLRGLDQRGPLAVPLLRGLSHQEYLALTTRADRLQGLRMETRALRRYEESNAFAHVLGYTGLLSAEEHAARPTYVLTDDIGKAGLERQYEQVLRGQHGIRRVEVDATGTESHDLGITPPVPGATLRLHLDAPLQRVVVDALSRGLAAAGVRKGAAIAMNPHTGAVRALASLPLYPHSTFAQGLGGPDVRGTLVSPESPLLNRAIQGMYSPGSAFKLAVATAGLEEGIVTPQTTVESRGGIRVGQWFFPDWKPGGHGRTNLVKALAESVNTYFYIVGGGVVDSAGLGIERLTAWARRLGLGEQTGIDLPEEAKGFLPSPEWKESEKHEAWYIGDTYHAAIGQGDILATPLQIALLTSIVANGGNLVTPRLVDAVVGPDGNVRQQFPPQIRAERVIRSETAAAIREGMRAAVTSGSGRGLQTLPQPVAAKTGTAQVGGSDRTHAWVTVIAPAEHTDIVLVVLVEEAPGGGDRFAVPVAREILSAYFTVGP